MQQSFVESLKEAGLNDDRIADVLNSGYYLRGWMSAQGSPPYFTVSDMLYGNKMQSSSFDLTEFVAYVRGERELERAPPLRRIKVKNIADIHAALAEWPRARYIEEGSLTFRGQPREYTIRRLVPNPFRKNDEGPEISIMPGVYRQNQTPYSCAFELAEMMAADRKRTFKMFAPEFEPNCNPFDLDFTYDLMRTEQHYATQTAGLDVAFHIKSALFFATHQFKLEDDGLTHCRKVPRGEHEGIIYLFRFGSPSVMRTEYLIQNFDFFKTYRPERIIRQSCGLPLFGPCERNIAVTEVDCVLELDTDFEITGGMTPEFMFPSATDDLFYQKLLEIKDREPELLSEVVEYQWARAR
jgi:hypothetical protein